MIYDFFQNTHRQKTSSTNNTTCSGRQMAGNHKKSASERETATPTLSAAVAQHRRLFNSMETEKSAAQMEPSQ